MRTASDVFMTPHEQPHIKRRRHGGASMGELVVQGDVEVKDGSTTRAHVIRPDQNSAGSQVGMHGSGARHMPTRTAQDATHKGGITSRFA